MFTGSYTALVTPFTMKGDVDDSRLKRLVETEIAGGVDIANDTTAKLRRDLPRQIVGLKEATGVVDRVSQLRALVDREFCILSGDDSLTLPMLSVGASGVISVASNVMPREVTDMVH